MKHFYRLVCHIEQVVLRCEMRFAGLCIAVLAVLMLANVGLRAVGRPMIWGDELAINLMIWSAFLGASIALATRQQMAVDLLAEHLAPQAAAWLRLSIDGVVLGAIILLSGAVWNWFDPIGLIRSGSAAALAAEEFNFIYQEPTLTLRAPKVLFWAILPVFCVCALLHALARIGEDMLGLQKVAMP